MDTQSILDAYTGRQWYIDDKNYYEEKIREYQEQLDITNEVLDVIKNVDLIYNNAPVHKMSLTKDILEYSRVDENNAGWRRSHLYTNFHDTGCYGITLILNKKRVANGSEEITIKDISDKKEATRLCLEFICRDCTPSEFKYDYDRQLI